jgi:hypothetical protein
MLKLVYSYSITHPLPIHIYRGRCCLLTRRHKCLRQQYEQTPCDIVHARSVHKFCFPHLPSFLAPASTSSPCDPSYAPFHLVTPSHLRLLLRHRSVLEPRISLHSRLYTPVIKLQPPSLSALKGLPGMGETPCCWGPGINPPDAMDVRRPNLGEAT